MPLRSVTSLAHEDLLRECRAELASLPTSSAFWSPGRLEVEVETGRTHLDAWRPPVGEELAVVAWRHLDPLRSRVVSCWTAPGHRSDEVLDELFGELTEPDRVPQCVVLPDHYVGVPAETLARLLRPRGFRHVRRVRLKAALAGFPLASPPAGVVLREARRTDRDRLLELFRRAYGLDADTLFGGEIDPERDAREYLDEEIFGRPSWDPGSSFVAVAGERAVGSVLTQRTDTGPLVADLMVDPDRRRGGIGSALLSSCARALLAGGETDLELTVTLSNPNRAYAFYVRRGFRLLDAPGRRPPGLWVRLSFLEERGVRLLSEAETPDPGPDL